LSPTPSLPWEQQEFYSSALSVSLSESKEITQQIMKKFNWKPYQDILRGNEKTNI